MTTELILLGTAGGPMPVPGRSGIASVLKVDDRVFLIDCGRGAPSRFVNEQLDFAALEAILLTHLHVDHTGDLAGMLLYPWGVRTGNDGPLPPIHVLGPGSPPALPQAGDSGFKRDTVIEPDAPVPGTETLVAHILAGWAYHLNVMPLDSQMPDPAGLVTATDLAVEEHPTVVYDVDGVRISAVQVQHGHAHPALGYRIDTSDGSIVFSGDTRVSDALIELAQGADALVHEVADLDFLEQHGVAAGLAMERMRALHTDVQEVGAVAERAGVDTLVLTHYLPAAPSAIDAKSWQARAAKGFSGTTIAGEDGFRFTLPR